MHRNYYEHLCKANVYEHIDHARSVRHAERAKYYASFGLLEEQNTNDIVEEQKTKDRENQNEKAVEKQNVVEIVESTEGPNDRIVNYLQCLFKLTRDLGLCFTSGAYVVDDKCGELKKYLEIALEKRKPLNKKFETHNRFGPRRKGFCPGVCELHIDENKLEVDCNDGSEYIRPIRNIKFYSFGDDGRWVYLKCESSMATYSLTHAWSAFKRYHLNIENETIRPSRREDCREPEEEKQGDNNRRKRKACVCTAEHCTERYHGEPNFISIIDEVLGKKVFTHERTRVFEHKRNYPGDRRDEYFVDKCLSNFILNNLKEILELKDNPVFIHAHSATI